MSSAALTVVVPVDGSAHGHVQRDPLSPASGVRAHLAEQLAGLVAVATHAREGIDRLRRRATAASTVHASVAPVLVVPVAAS